MIITSVKISVCRIKNKIPNKRVRLSKQDTGSIYKRPMQTDARNKSEHCCVLLANKVASVCMDLNVCPVSNYEQQVPTMLWFHANGRSMLDPTMLRVVGQQCCLRLHGPLKKFQTKLNP